MFPALYYRNKTTTESSLNETSLGGGSFISNASTPSDKDDMSEPGTSSSLGGTTTSLRIILKWYALIIILSVLVVTGIIFVVCRLSIKAEAYRKSGLGSNQDSLLFSDNKASALPISLDLNESSDL